LQVRHSKKYAKEELYQKNVWQTSQIRIPQFKMFPLQGKKFSLYSITTIINGSSRQEVKESSR
jgi:hypothetical protein